MDKLHQAIIEEYAQAPKDRLILAEALQQKDGEDIYLQEKNTYAWYFAIGKVIQPEVIIEFGTRFGYSAIAIAAGSQNKPDYTGIDNQSWEAGSNKIAMDAIKPFVDRCSILDSDSAAAFILGKADLIHIDNCHTRESVLADLEKSLVALDENGYILVNNITYNPEAKQASAEFCEQHQLQYIDLPSYRGIRLIGI